MPYRAPFNWAPDAVVVVQRGATDAVSAVKLAAAYAVAKTLLPGGNALSATNRARVCFPAGGYDFGTGTFTLDANFVDLEAMSPGLAAPPLPADQEWAGQKDAVTFAGVTWRPAATRIYGTAVTAAINEAWVSGVVVQLANDVRLSGFEIANLHVIAGAVDSDSGAEPVGGFTTPIKACGLLITATDNSPSVYEKMSFYVRGSGLFRTLSDGGGAGNADSHWCRFPVAANSALGGTWRRCVANGHAWRVKQHPGGNPGTMSGLYEDLVAGAMSFIGDEGPTVTARFYRCRGTAHYNYDNADSYEKNDADTPTPLPGYACFCGCRSFSGGIGSSAYFEDCAAGDHSFGMGDASIQQNSGTFIRCRAGKTSFAGTKSGGNKADFAGYAEDCYALAGSFGGGSANSKLTGTLVRCTIIGNIEAIYCYGAKIRDCHITVTTTGKHGLILKDGATRVLNTTILVLQGGTGVPITDGGLGAQNVVAAHCRFNNAANDADGIAAAVTNLVGTPANVCDDDLAF